LVSIKSYNTNFQLSNESIEHLSNFPHLRNLDISPSTNVNQSVTNFSLLSNLRRLSMSIQGEFQDPEFFKDLGLFSNLIDLYLCSINGFLKITNLTVFLLYYLFSF